MGKGTAFRSGIGSLPSLTLALHPQRGAGPAAHRVVGTHQAVTAHILLPKRLPCWGRLQSGGGGHVLSVPHLWTHAHFWDGFRYPWRWTQSAKDSARGCPSPVAVRAGLCVCSLSTGHGWLGSRWQNPAGGSHTFALLHSLGFFLPASKGYRHVGPLYVIVFRKARAMGLGSLQLCACGSSSLLELGLGGLEVEAGRMCCPARRCPDQRVALELSAGAERALASLPNIRFFSLPAAMSGRVLSHSPLGKTGAGHACAQLLCFRAGGLCQPVGGCAGQRWRGAGNCPARPLSSTVRPALPRSTDGFSSCGP